MATRIEYGNTPWGAAWVQALTAGGNQNGYTDPRLIRGRSYANSGKVHDIEFIGSTVLGKVQGTAPRPYKVAVDIRPYTPAQKNLLLSFIAANPTLAQELSRGILPEWFMGWLRDNRLPISPISWDEMTGDCSCPDWGNPCKHQVAVFYALAHDLDRAPLLLFHLRGVTTKEILQAAGENPQSDFVPPLPLPTFIQFSEAVRPVPPEKWADEEWHQDWFISFATKSTKQLMELLPSKPRFSTAQYDFRDFLKNCYDALSERISDTRTGSKKPSAMPDIWLEFNPDSHGWQAFATAPEGNIKFMQLQHSNGTKTLKLTQWSGSILRSTLQTATPCSLAQLINACSSVAGFSKQRIHTPSSRFFCAALDIAYMLASTHSIKPVIIRIDDRKAAQKAIANQKTIAQPNATKIHQLQRSKTGALPPKSKAFKAQALKSQALQTQALKAQGTANGVETGTPKSQYFIRYEPFVQTPEEKATLVRYMNILRALLPPEMLMNHTRNSVMSPEAFAMLFSTILTAVVQDTLRPVASFYYFKDPIAQAFIQPLPLPTTNISAQALANDLYDWIAWLDVSTMEIMPIFRVEEPSDEALSANPDTPFMVHCDVQDCSNPLSEPVPLRQILNARGRILGQEAIKIQALVMLVMDDATKHFPQLQWALDTRNPERGAPIEIPLSELYAFLTDTAERLRELGVSVVLPLSLVNLLRPRPRAKAKGKDGVSFISMLDLVEFDYDIAIGDEHISIVDFKRLLKNTKGLMRFHNSYVMLTPTEAKSLLQKLEHGVRLNGQAVLRAALAGEEDGFIFDGDEAFKRAFQKLTTIEDISLPNNINATLRPYQERGFQWMYSTMERGFGIILADDMGLGKTLQALALLQRLKLDGKLPHHALIVCPTTLVTNWLRECNRFTPYLTASIYHGADRTFDFEGSDIVITTYGIVRREAKEFAAHPWSIMVVDEAQNLKNHETAQTKAVKTIPAPMRLALSGTPVENRLSELWSLFDWLNKGYLHGITRFRDDFARPIERENDTETINRLRRITAPFILRRLKSDKSIIADLPDKIITNEYCTLTKEQAAIYENEVKRALAVIEGKDEDDTIARSGLIFSMITALKQICNHPAHYAKKGNPVSKDSGKAARLIDLLDSIQESDEKALIFTQYKEMGTLLEQMIGEELNAEALFFHGGVSRTKRDAIVETFQTDPTKRFMIVSLKAGGTGLNLTAATNVIHYDLWWNPAVENQATDRAYRIGQAKNVQVHRFITQATFEEKIDAMLQAKQELANLTIGTGENWITDLSNKELREIFTLER